MEKKFVYDAFISYRHTELDKFVAENLHKQLEAFRLPKSIAKRRKGQKTKIERVFRDKEELPLTSNLNDPIMAALNTSEWLIVICSPRLRESMWCKKEIETFVALRGRERVLAVLIEGEPADSFPDELLYRTETKTLPDGTCEEVKVPVEPLAADVRGKTKKEVLKAMKTEVLRLCAAMFELNYDDLRQRHKEQRMKRILTASLIGGAACLAFGVYSTATALRINSQKKQIEEQSAEILAQSEEILQQNNELALRQARSLAELATGYLDAGNRAGAVRTAVEALTESEGIALPYTPEAQMILAESLRVYDVGEVYKASYQYETAGRIESVIESPDSKTLAIYDDTQSLILFDLENAEVLEIFTAEDYDFFGSYGCTFIGDDRFAYVNTENKICIYDLNSKEVIKEIETDGVSKLVSDENGTYLAAQLWKSNFTVYSVDTYEELGTTPEVETDIFTGGPYISSDGILACAYSTAGEFLEEIYTLYFIDLKTMETISTYDIGQRELKDMKMQDGVAYLSVAKYDDVYSGSDAYAMAIDISTGNLLWEVEKSGYWPREVVLPINEGATDLIFITSESAYLLDMQTGSESLFITLPSPVVEANVYTNNNNFLLFCEDGEMLAVSKEYEQSFDLSYRFECKTQSNEAIMHSSTGITVLGSNDNKITVYTAESGPDVVQVDTVVDFPEEAVDIIGDEAVEIVRNYGLEKPEFVRSLYYSDNKEICFITYWDYNFVIYDVANNQILNAIEDAYPTVWYLGTDETGFTYILGYYGIYILDTDMEPVTWIPEGRAVDMEAGKVYIAYNDYYYEAPIYGVDDLLKIAQN